MLSLTWKGSDSAGHPSGAALKAAGIGATGIYLTGSFAATPAMVADYTAHGIWIWSIFEVNPQSPAGGANHGSVDATSALRAAKALGMPKGAAIYFACDTDGIPYETALDYWRGTTVVRQSGFKVGGYGPHAYMTQALGAHVLDAAFVAGGWENGQPETGIAIKQQVAAATVGGVTVDCDEVLLPASAGLWNGHGLYVPVAPPAPKPVPPKPSPTPEVTKVLHTITGKIGANGEVLIDTSIPWVARQAATPQTEEGAQSTATVRWTNAAGHVRLVVRGEPNEAVSVDVLATA